jgi:hypothetical protein
VREAIAAGKFQIFAIENIDEGLSLLTGLPSGSRDEHGCYEPESLNRLITDAFGKFAQQRRDFSNRPEKGNGT